MARWLFIESHWAGLRHWCQQAVEVATLDGSYHTVARIRRRLQTRMDRFQVCAVIASAPKTYCHRIDDGDPENAAALLK
jgi:hypothetical protein